MIYVKLVEIIITVIKNICVRMIVPVYKFKYFYNSSL